MQIDRKWHLAVLIMAVTCISGCFNPVAVVAPIPYSAAQIKARVVDETTGQPVAGVIVIASWTNYTVDPFSGSIESGPGNSCNELVNLKATTTDTDGQFIIPGWSGKFGHCTYMSTNQPELLLYAPSYVARNLHNSDADDYGQYPDGFVAAISTSRWNGQTIKMRPLGPHRSDGAGDLFRDSGMYYPQNEHDTYVFNLEGFSGELEQILTRQINATHKSLQRACYWDEVRPAMLMLLEEERRMLPYTEFGLKYGLNLFDWDLSHPQERFGTDWSCGDQKAYIDGLQAEVDTVLADLPYPSNPLAGGEIGAIDTEVVDQVRASLARTPATSSEHDEGIVYHLNIHTMNPARVLITAIYPFNVKPEHAGNPYKEPHSFQLWAAEHGFHCEDLKPPETHVKQGAGLDRFECGWSAPLNSPIYCASLYCRFPDYIGNTRTWALTEAFLSLVDTAVLPAFLEIDNTEGYSIVTTLPPAGDHLWRLPQRGQKFVVLIRPSDSVTWKDDPCEKVLPDGLKQAITLQYPWLHVPHRYDFEMDPSAPEVRENACPSILRGDFDGSGRPGYLISLKGYSGTPELWLVFALSSSDDWSITSAEQGCMNIHDCRLELAKPGTYTATADPSTKLRIQEMRRHLPLLERQIPLAARQMPNNYVLLMEHAGYVLTQGNGARLYGYYNNGKLQFIMQSPSPIPP